MNLRNVSQFIGSVTTFMLDFIVCHRGLNGILYAQPIADVLSALITVFMAIPLHKSLTIAEQKMKTTSIPCDRQ